MSTFLAIVEQGSSSSEGALVLAGILFGGGFLGILIIALFVIQRRHRKSVDQKAPRGKRGNAVQAFALSHGLAFSPYEEVSVPGPTSDIDIHRPFANVISGLWRGISIRAGDAAERAEKESLAIVSVRRDLPRLTLEHDGTRWSAREGDPTILNEGMRRWLSAVDTQYRFSIRHGYAVTSHPQVSPEAAGDLLDTATEFVLRVVG